MKEERKIDRRVIKTRRAILEAFMNLVATTPYDKITISSLAREANIDRKTFYLHYDSIGTLLEDVMANKLTEMLESSESHETAQEESPSEQEQPITTADSALAFLTDINHAFHRTLVENSSLLKNLSSDAVLGATRNVLMKMALESIHTNSREDADEIALAAAFFLGGVVGAYRQALASRHDASFETISEEIEAMSLSFIEMSVSKLAAGSGSFPRKES